MKKTLFVFFTFSAFLLAYTPESICNPDTFLRTCFPYVVYDDIRSTVDAFDSVGMIFNHSTAWNNMVDIIILCFCVVLIIKASFGSGFAPNGIFLTKIPAYILGVVLLLATMNNQALKVTMTIADGRSLYKTYTNGGQNLRTVGNIPISIAIIASLTNYLSSSFVKIVEETSTPINGTKYTDIGAFKYFSLIDRKKMVSIRDLQEPEITAFLSSYDNYIQSCFLPFKSNFKDSVPDVLGLGKGSIKNVSPANLVAKLPGSQQALGNDFFSTIFVDGKNVSCNQYWNNHLVPTVSPAMDIYKKYLLTSLNINDAFEMNISDGLNNGLMAGSQEVLDANMGNLSSYMQYMVRGQLDIMNDRAIAAKALGMGAGIASDSVNQATNSAFLKLHDTINQSKFFFSLETMPIIITIINCVFIFSFPFVIFFSALGGFNRIFKVLSVYVISFLSVALIPSGLALAHSIILNYTKENALTHLLKIGTDYVHNYEYYQFMATNAELASNVGLIIALGFPALVLTGSAGYMFFGMAQSTASLGRTQGVEGSIREMTQAQDAVNRGLENAAANKALIDAINANNESAIAKMGISRDIDSYSRGYIGSGIASAGNVAGFGSSIINQKDLDMMYDGGRFQGIQASSSIKTLGAEMNHSQNLFDKNGNFLGSVSGESMAKTLGTSGALNQIGGAKGLVASGAFDSGGNIANTSQGKNYTQGLENNARISTNQVQGAGKEGRFTNEEMNAIQYNAQAGIQSQIASGQSLREAYGNNLSGGGSVGSDFKSIAKDLADLQNLSNAATSSGFNANKRTLGMDNKAYFDSIKQSSTHQLAENLGMAKAQGENISRIGVEGIRDNAATNTSKNIMDSNASAEVNRENFGDLSGGFGSRDYQQVAKGNASLQTAKTIGNAAGFNEINGNGDGIDKIARVTQSSVAAPIEAINKTATNARKNFDDTVSMLQHTYTSQQARDNTKNLASFNEEIKRGVYGNGGVLSNEARGNIIAQGYNEGARSAGETLNYISNTEAGIRSAIANSETFKNLGLSQDDVSKLRRGDYEHLSNQAKQKLMQYGKDEYKKLTGENLNITGETSGFLGYDFNLNKINQNKAIALDAGIRSVSGELTKLAGGSQSDFFYKTSSSNITGMLNGDSFNITGGAGGHATGGMSSGVSYSHNESRNYSYGVNASGGSYMAKVASKMGMNMETYANIASGIEMAGQVTGVAMALAPGGAVGSALSRFGAIGADSAYAVGVSRASAIAKRSGQGLSDIETNIKNTTYDIKMSNFKLNEALKKAEEEGKVIEKNHPLRLTIDKQYNTLNNLGSKLSVEKDIYDSNFGKGAANNYLQGMGGGGKQ